MPTLTKTLSGPILKHKTLKQRPLKQQHPIKPDPIKQSDLETAKRRYPVGGDVGELNQSDAHRGIAKLGTKRTMPLKQRIERDIQRLLDDPSVLVRPIGLPIVHRSRHA